MTHDIAGTAQSAENKIDQMVELGFAVQSSSEKESDKEGKEWLYWIPDKPQRKGAALNMQSKWGKKPRAASEVILTPNCHRSMLGDLHGVSFASAKFVAEQGFFACPGICFKLASRTFNFISAFCSCSTCKHLKPALIKSEKSDIFSCPC